MVNKPYFSVFVNIPWRPIMKIALSQKSILLVSLVSLVSLSCGGEDTNDPADEWTEDVVTTDDNGITPDEIGADETDPLDESTQPDEPVVDPLEEYMWLEGTWKCVEENEQLRDFFN